MDGTRTQERLSAIAEPTRFRIVELLRAGPRPVGAIVDALGVGQPQVSRHLRVLADAGVVGVTKNGQRRIYRLLPEPIQDLEEWIAGLSATWSDRLDRLGTLLDDKDGAAP
jgi:DNA-binding transcriptional ArsR family regulator